MSSAGKFIEEGVGLFLSPSFDFQESVGSTDGKFSLFDPALTEEKADRKGSARQRIKAGRVPSSPFAREQL